MYPELISFGPITLYSFGAMLATAFLVGSWLLKKEWMRTGHKNAAVPDQILMVSVVGGMVGSKLLYALTEGRQHLIADPFGTLFSGAGLVFHGGLILGLVGFIWIVRRNRLSWLAITDVSGPILMLGYGITRIGCFLSGDGDYGPPSDLPWAMSFPGGTVPTWERVHPTPVYEVLGSGLVFALLWKMRAKKSPLGWMTAWSFMGIGLERLIAEIWRINPVLAWGLSQAQWISIALMIVGGWMIYQRWSAYQKGISKSK